MVHSAPGSLDALRRRRKDHTLWAAFAKVGNGPHGRVASGIQGGVETPSTLSFSYVGDLNIAVFLEPRPSFAGAVLWVVVGAPMARVVTAREAKTWNQDSNYSPSTYQQDWLHILTLPLVDFHPSLSLSLSLLPPIKSAFLVHSPLLQHPSYTHTELMYSKLHLATHFCLQCPLGFTLKLSLW